MSEYVPYLVFGLTTGSVYGISAMGLVLTYKTSGLFNFAHGAVSAVAAFVFYSLRQQHHLPWPVAGVITVFVLGPILAFILEWIASRLANVSVTYRIVATIGLLVVVLAATQIKFGVQSLVFNRFLPQHAVFVIDGVQVTVDDLTDVLLGVLVAVGLSLFFSRSRLGTEMRAVVDDAPLLDMTGISPTRVRRAAWLIGSMFACLSGVLFAAAQQQLDVVVLSLLVVQAFGAAAIGRFTNLPMAFVGGVILGLLQNIASKVVGTHGSLQGLDTNMPFIVLIVLLLVIPRAKLVEVGRQVKNLAVPASRFDPRARAAGYAVVLVGAIIVPQVVGGHLPIWDTALTQVLLFASLGLLVRTSGQISLCQVGFAAVGAAGFAHMLHDGVPWGLAVLIGGLIALPVGAIVAIPSFRLSGLYLGLVTLGFGILLTEYAYTKTWFFGGEITTSGPHAWGFEGDKAFYYLLLVITILGLGLVVAIERSRLGRLLRGLSDSSLALSTLGTNVNVARFLVFCASAFLAGVSGGLYASLFGSVGEATYPYTQSLIVLTVLVISGRRTIFAAIVAPILLYVPPGYISSLTTQLWLQVAFGVAAVFVALNSQGAITRGVVSFGNSDQDSRDPATLRATPFHGRNAPVGRSGPIRRRAAGTSLTVGGTR